jgi:predicted TIM-barrel fold metal-dependent hydrolase
MVTRRKMMAAASLPLLSVHQAGGTELQPGRCVPHGTCDTHVHVLDPARFPFSPRRRYTPGSAAVEQLVQVHAALGLDRFVVVHNSVYGTDNSCLLDALGRLGRARGVGIITAAMMDAEIAPMDEAGTRGTRLNLEVGRDRNTAAAEGMLRDAAARIPAGWHVHINAALSVPVVLDHFAHAGASGGLDQTGMQQLLALLRQGKAVVKLSGPYQVSREPGYGDIASVARALVDAAPPRVMWDSDWPHTGGAGRPADQLVEFIEPFRPEDDTANLALLVTWVPDAALRRTILVDTPARFYGFPAA